MCSLIEPPRAASICNQQASENSVLFRNVPANREPGAFFAAQRNFVLANQLADVFEAHWSLVSRLAAGLSGGVNHLRSGHAACGGHVPLARFHQIVIDEREDLIEIGRASCRE